MNIDTLSLQAFLIVAETKSFTKAAEQIGRTQSAISQQIAKLEQMLGKSLFVRGKELSLTEEGEVLLSYARKIFALEREIFDRFKQPELQGKVNFGLPEDFASVFLSEVLADFSRSHPRILLNISCDLTLNLFDRFKQKQFDLVLVKMNRPEDFPNGQQIWSEPLEWVGSSDFVDFSNSIPLVLSPSPCVYRKGALDALEKANIKWRLAFSSPSYAGTIAAVKAGMGITVLPRNMIPKGLIIIKDSRLPKLDNIHLSLLKHQNDNAAINSLEEFVLNKLNLQA